MHPPDQCALKRSGRRLSSRCPTASLLHRSPRWQRRRHWGGPRPLAPKSCDLLQVRCYGQDNLLTIHCYSKGCPKGEDKTEDKKKYSLTPVVGRLSEALGKPASPPPAWFALSSGLLWIIESATSYLMLPSQAGR